MATYRVREGKELPHNGEVLRGGAVVELPPHIGYEVRHLAVEIDALGREVSAGADDAALKAELERAKPHERISILQAARTRVAGDLAELDAAVADEKKRLEAEAKAAAPKKTAAAPAAPEKA